MSSRTYREVVDALARTGAPLRELGGSSRVAVTPAAGRIVALSFSPASQNLLWTHPDLGETDRGADNRGDLIGGIGGDRLWFAPEVDYHWNGAPRWDTFENYSVPSASDPGHYRFRGGAPDEIHLDADVELQSSRTGLLLCFSVERKVRLVPPPLPWEDLLSSGVEYVGIETRHVLRLSDAARSGRVDLWHLLQMPVGAVLVVPIRAGATSQERSPLSYGPSGSWEPRNDFVQWRYAGTARAKFGLPARAVTGRAGVLQLLADGRLCLLVRDFDARPDALYADHPYGVERSDQLLQAWDGFGFGELEYHSPMLDAARSARELTESDRLWAFGGSRVALADIGRRLLGVDLSAVLDSFT